MFYDVDFCMVVSMRLIIELRLRYDSINDFLDASLRCFIA